MDVLKILDQLGIKDYAIEKKKVTVKKPDLIKLAGFFSFHLYSTAIGFQFKNHEFLIEEENDDNRDD